MAHEPNARTAVTASLTAIPGLDAERPIGVLNGNLAAYLHLLRRYVTDHADDMDRLREQMAQGDRDGARHLAHTLKGSSANLGATEMQRLAAELEAAIRDGRDAMEIGSMTGSAEVELQRLTAAVRASLPQEDAAACTDAIDWVEVRQIMAELEPLLAGFSVQANQVIEPRAALLKAALGSLGAELEQQIENYLYPEALETLRRAKQEHPQLAAP